VINISKKLILSLNIYHKYLLVKEVQKEKVFSGFRLVLSTLIKRQESGAMYNLKIGNFVNFLALHSCFQVTSF